MTTNENVQVCEICDLPTEGEFLEMCVGHEGWADSPTVDHYYRRGVGPYSWGYKGICHRSGVVSLDTPLLDSPKGIGCMFCRAILLREKHEAAALK